MPDTPPVVPSVDAVKAAQLVDADPPVTEVEPEPEMEELPEGQDSFPREYVEKQRGENAKWRTRTREIEQHFEGYQPEEQARFLELASQLQNDPEGALEQFEDVTNRLRQQLGKDAPVADPVVPDPAPVADPVVPAADAPLTVADVNRLVGERIQAEAAATAKQTEIDATLAEAEALGDGEQYKNPAAKAALFATAQKNQVSLAEAHDLLTTDFGTAVDAAVEARMEEVRSGKAYPPRLPTGDPASTQATGSPKTFEEAKAASLAREQANAARYGQ